MSEDELAIFREEATKIASSPVIQNAELVQNDIDFKPNWYMDLVRENPVYGIYKEFAEPEKVVTVHPKKDFFAMMNERYVNFDWKLNMYMGGLIKKLPHDPSTSYKSFDYQIPESIQEEVDEHYEEL